MLFNSELTCLDSESAIRESRLDTYVHGVESRTMRKAGIDKGALKLLLAEFKSHSLEDLNNAGLMNRVDTKYLLPAGDLKKLLLLLAPLYTVLEIDFLRLFTYQTTYFDTPEFGFYLMHHNGKLNRFKIRQRLYVDSEDLYVELKHKTNKRVTRKDRVLINGNNGSRDRVSALTSKPFEGRHLPIFKSLVCSYIRIAMADEHNGERLTLDLNLSFKDPKKMRKKQFNQVLIAEVKRKNRKAPSVFMDLMDSLHYKPVSFSKYCIGCALLYSEQIKTNRFKETLTVLDQISR